MMSSELKKRSPAAEATLTMLWERVRKIGDLPGFAKAVSSILSAMRGEEELEFNMTQTVLSDPALTQKVLRLANSAMYSAFGQKIATVSKAVIVLGTETIGHLALGLKLIDELTAVSPDSNAAHLEMEKAVLAGHVARQVAATANYHDAEEAVVCSMLHSLGRMMVVFYMADKWTEVKQKCANASGFESQSHAEDLCAEKMLDISLEDIGRATAEKWGFPSGLLNSMRQIMPEVGASAPLTQTDWLAALSTMSVSCADALCEADEMGAEQLRKLTSGYADMLGVDANKMMGAIEVAKQSSSAELTAVHVARRNNAEKRAGSSNVKVDSEDLRRKLVGILRHGIADMQDVSNSATPSQMMAMALESIYQGLGQKRAVAFMHNYKDGKYVGKISFGAGMNAMLPHLVFDDSRHPDVFHAALASDKIIYIEHAKEPDFAAKLPHWWRATLQSAHSFMILPLSLNNHPAGFIYGDWAEDAAPFQLTETEYLLLNEIRAKVVHSLERRRQAIAVATAQKTTANRT